ncbi:SCO family protein [Pseudofrankia sp. DC12]|uniref:SCO family protein n=1 Tax=Pseudofrankia sp. DC12 TaxID=683315 RepID=UPI0005F7F74B|nr:SCO family protein [Pseudofrankia sp. DC12]
MNASADRPGRRRRRTHPVVTLTVLGAAVLVLTAALAGCGGSSASSTGVVNLDDAPKAAGLRGPELATPLPMPDIRLTDTAGRPYDVKAATGGKLTFVYFGYTHCPDVCPTTMADIARALDLVPAADRGRVAVVFITTDPDRDTGPVIRSWLDQFNPSFVGLRGPLAQVADYAGQLGVPLAAPQRQADGTVTVDHGAQVTAFSPDGTARTVYLANTQVEDYAHDIPLLLKETQ